MRSLVTIALQNNRFGSSDIPMFAKIKIHRVPGAIDGPIEIHTNAAHLDGCLIAAPRAADGTEKALPFLLELRFITLDPTEDRALVHGNAALSHHLGEIFIGKLVTQVPAHAQDDDFRREMPPLEKIAERRLLPHAVNFGASPSTHSARQLTIPKQP
jgi:hypothetical protein